MEQFAGGEVGTIRIPSQKMIIKVCEKICLRVSEFYFKRVPASQRRMHVTKMKLVFRKVSIFTNAAPRTGNIWAFPVDHLNVSSRKRSNKREFVVFGEFC